MGRDATGTAVWYKGRWHARITAKDADGRTIRPFVDLERPEIPHTPKGREQAKRLARERAELARRAVFVGPDDQAPDDAPPTVASVADK